MSGPNDLLREARERTPSRRAPGEHLSRSELAEAICAWLWETTEIKYELDGHYIAKLERGAVRWPGAAYRSGLRHVLGVASDNDLGFFPPNGAALTEPEPLPPASMADRDDDLVNAGDESIALLSFAEESNVGELTVEQLQADIERIAQSYLRTPIRPLFAKSRAIRDRAFGLLAGNQSPRRSRDLYAAAGWAITLLAWMSVDLGRPDIAEGHTRTAWACAEAADHDVLRGWIRATQHTAAYWQEDFERAAAYAEDGLRYSAGTARLFLASAASVDLARSGRADRSRELLDVAQSLVVRPAGSEPGGVLLCTPERAEGLWADTHLAFGDAHRTAEHADHSIAQFEAVPYALRNAGSERMARLQQAKARVLLGELDGAVDAVEPVLQLAPEYRVRPLIQRVAEVGALTAPYARSPQGRMLRDRIAEFIRQPGLPFGPDLPNRRRVLEEQK
ncbi:hypothetical protein [Kribbella sp. NPDC048915]|uniref:hypothetical protein n=1 Tax=Kribbella sp. NPDC048915 TaxID=3155148 RepID=UPI0033FAD29E